jgi:diguanylate cyclase (GGDEF)-like protein
MDTQTIVTIAVVINVVIALIAIGAPRLAPSRRATPARTPALSELSGPRRDPRDIDSASAMQSDADADPAAAWFPDSGVADADAGGSFATAPRTGDLDPVTGLDLPAAWTRWLNEEDARIRRFHRSATVVLVELGGLDRLAERLGTETADRLIPPIALTMRRYGRETDHIARLSHTRFAALLTETDEVRAINYVERIRGACDLWLASGAISLRLAIGWAEIGPNEPAAVAVPEAERRLFADRQRPHADDRASTARREPPVSLVAAPG